MSNTNTMTVKSYKDLYEYADYLKWAEQDLRECYQDMKVHASAMSTEWNDSSAERFMQFLEKEQHIIEEISGEFERFEGAVRQRAGYVEEYVAVGRQYGV